MKRQLLGARNKFGNETDKFAKIEKANYRNILFIKNFCEKQRQLWDFVKYVWWNFFAKSAAFTH